MPATDSFLTNSTGLESPIENAFAVTPHDTNELSVVTRAILVGGAGNVNGTFANDSTTVTLTGLLAGVVYPFRLKLIRSTLTTATNITGLY